MTRDNTLSSKSAGHQTNSNRQQPQPPCPKNTASSHQQVKSSLIDSAPSTVGAKRPTSSSGGGGKSACGSLIQRRHSESHFCSHNPNGTDADSNERTLSGLDESSGSVHHPSTLAATATDPTINELSMADHTLESTHDSSGSEQISRLSSMLLKQRIVYYEGKLRTVFVQVWPDGNRIPVHQRHRLQEPMKHRYGKLSHKNRLLKEFEKDKKRSTPITITLLPKRMHDEARIRLMAWYRPLRLPATHRFIVSSDQAFRLPSSVIPTHHKARTQTISYLP